MKKRLGVFVSALIIFLTISFSAFASSSYVLPYPSTMPGSLMYKPHLVLEEILRYWYFGSFGQFSYSLKQSDKYLIEAKTLFEYNQYLLGFDALKKSDMFFKQTLPYLKRAEGEGKDISLKRETLTKSSEKHIEILLEIGNKVPVTVVWRPEKSASSVLNLKSLIDSAIVVRNKSL